jgi:hypothetical protein
MNTTANPPDTIDLTKPIPVIVNGHTIEPLDLNAEFKWFVTTKKQDVVKFTTLKDARRWARLN